MGQELIIGVAYQRHPERTAEELEALVGTLTVERAAKMYENAYQISYEERNGDTDDLLLVVTHDLREALATVSGDEYDRNVMIINDLDGRAIAIGGGSSWGETPDGMDMMNMLEAWGEW